jgi:hypothetical protein
MVSIASPRQTAAGHQKEKMLLGLHSLVWPWAIMPVNAHTDIVSSKLVLLVTNRKMHVANDDKSALFHAPLEHGNLIYLCWYRYKEKCYKVFFWFKKMNFREQNLC